MDDESRDFIIEPILAKTIIIIWIVLVLALYTPQFFEPEVYTYYWDSLIKPFIQLMGL